MPDVINDGQPFDVESLKQHLRTPRRLVMIDESGVVTPLPDIEDEKMHDFLSIEHRTWIRSFFGASSLECRMLDQIEKLENESYHADEQARFNAYEQSCRDNG